MVLSTLRLDRISLLDDNRMALCFCGAGLLDLSELLKRAGREPHSSLGSLFLNPTVGAGVALGSGGVPLRKGPVQTERMLYLRVGAGGEVQLVNSLGVKGIPDGCCDDWGVLDRLDSAASPLELEPSLRSRPASAAGWYGARVSRGGPNVARWNGAAGAGGGGCGSEGHVVVLASLHDTFPAPASSETLWVAADSAALCAELRRWGRVVWFFAPSFEHCPKGAGERGRRHAFVARISQSRRRSSNGSSRARHVAGDVVVEAGGTGSIVSRAAARSIHPSCRNP